jgi:hypothetical protein
MEDVYVIIFKLTRYYLNINYLVMLIIMDSHLIYYLNLISKLTDILTYIDLNFQEDDISSYIKECKSLCVNKVKSEPLVELFLSELKHELLNEQLNEKLNKRLNRKLQEKLLADTTITVLNPSNGEEPSFSDETKQEILQTDPQTDPDSITLEEVSEVSLVPVTQEDMELKEHIDSLSSLISIQPNSITPDTFDTFGSGLAKLFRGEPSNIPVQSPPIRDTQIKNEINLINTNINFEIKKKNEQ